MASFAHFVRDNPVADLKLGERGAKRQEYLEKFLIFQTRQKNAKKQLVSTRETVQGKTTFIDHHWWAMEKMDGEVGPAKAKHWRESGKLFSRPDSLTGSKDPQHIEYCVPVHWESVSEQDLRTLKLNMESEATEDDVGLFTTAMDTFALTDASGSGSQVDPASIKVKTEPGEEATQAKEIEIMGFKNGLEATFKEFQALELELKHIRAKAEQGAHKYTAGIVADADSLSKKLKKFYTMLEKMLMEPGSVSEDKIPDVIAKKKALITEVNELKEWASKLGVSIGNGKKKRKVGKA